MKFYKDNLNCIWLPDDSEYQADFQNYQKERRILRILINECIEKYDPFVVFSAFCASDYAHLICQNNHKGYFYGEGTFLDDLNRMGLLTKRELDWDICIFHWIIDLYLTARYSLGMTYREIACNYPIHNVYKAFNPLHETSELNALQKMKFDKKPLAGCIINDAYYLFRDDIPVDKRYLLSKISDAKACHTCFCSNALFFDDSAIENLGIVSHNMYRDKDYSYNSIISLLQDFFLHNSDLKNKLLDSNGLFVYCSMDTRLGIGLSILNYIKINQYQWRGQNLLGFALQEVYNKLREINNFD